MEFSEKELEIIQKLGLKQLLDKQEKKKLFQKKIDASMEKLYQVEEYILVRQELCRLCGTVTVYTFHMKKIRPDLLRAERLMEWEVDSLPLDVEKEEVETTHCTKCHSILGVQQDIFNRIVNAFAPPRRRREDKISDTLMVIPRRRRGDIKEDTDEDE
jgi:ribosomal protein S27AE